MKTYLINNRDGIEKQKFMDLYEEGIETSAKLDKITVKECEDDYWDYMKIFFEDDKGLWFVLKDEERYYAGIRLYPQGNNSFFVEAFEVVPGYRGQGLGKQLYKDVQNLLSKQYKHFKLVSTTWKTNIPSIKAHISVGFKQVLDCSIKDNKRNENDVTLEFKK